MSRPAHSPALLYIPAGPNAQVSFRVVTPEHHSVATTIEPGLAAVTALAVARHHAARYSVIAASDGRWLDVQSDGQTTLGVQITDATGWPTLVARALDRLVPSGQPPSGDAA
jgi:hypothetical protein